LAEITSDQSGAQSKSAGATAQLQRLIRLPAFMRWVAVLGIFVVVLIVCLAAWGPDMDFPSEVSMEKDGVSEPREISRLISDEIKKGTTWLVRNWGSMFDGIDKAITLTMVQLEDGLRWIPWPATFLGVVAMAAVMAGWRLALFALLSLVFIGLMNRWDSSVETIAIILFSVVISVVIALPLGILGGRSNRADATMSPILDGMQTMPSYVYLVPGILFFGLGYTPAVIATVIYAVPPAIRLTNLGIRQVSPATVEAARAFGASPTQILAKVQIPMALPTIMAGINQTTMLALSMVVIASLVGASGLGEDVFRALQRQDPGNSVIAGMSIVLIAIVFDRLTQAAARSRQEALQDGN
jgi:glycine betaine/proline transport system permease protein